MTKMSTFPVKPYLPNRTAPQPLSSVRGRRPLRVLVVDDSKDTADSLQMLMKSWGYDAQVAYEGEVVVAAAIAYRPNVIMLDIGMPKLGGFEIAKRLRNEKRIGGVLIVALTGYADELHRRQGMEAGCDLYLVKPVFPKVIHDLLKDLGRKFPLVDSRE